MFRHVVSYVEIMSFCVLSNSVDEINNVNDAVSEWTKSYAPSIISSSLSTFRMTKSVNLTKYLSNETT